MKSVEEYIEVYRSLKLDDVVNYNKFNEYVITAHSTQIEGSTLTDEETSLLIDEGITPKGKPLEHTLMVTDHHKALRFVLKVATDKIRINPELICNINAHVMASTGKTYNTVLGNVDSSKGELRKGQVYVSKRYFPDYQKVPQLLSELCESLREKMDKADSIKEKLYLSFSAHFNLVSIHPHYDGNGRTSRLLMNLIQRWFGLPLGMVHKEDKLEYFAALEDSREKEMIEPFNEFMESQYKKQLATEIEKYNTQVDKRDKGMGMNFLY
ncbi:MAG: Fic family protein [Cyclobacteriaceae bacterium]